MANTANTTNTAVAVQNVNTGDAFFGDNVGILFQKDRWVEFFPTVDQTLPERMNAIARLIIYISVALAIYQGRATAIHFGVLLLGILYLIWRTQTVAILATEGSPQVAPPTKETFSPIKETSSPASSFCTSPTVQNPYMNWMVGDDPAKPAACTGPGVQEQAANLLDQQLFSDVNDLYSRESGQRNFRTMPSSTAVPDTKKFADWLFQGEKNCKTDRWCPPFEDLRFHQQDIPESNGLNVAGFNL